MNYLRMDDHPECEYYACMVAIRRMQSVYSKITSLCAISEARIAPHLHD